jgi:hypothetical protein
VRVSTWITGSLSGLSMMVGTALVSLGVPMDRGPLSLLMLFAGVGLLMAAWVMAFKVGWQGCRDS